MHTDAGGEGDGPRYYSQIGAAAMEREILRLRAENEQLCREGEQLRRENDYWRDETNRWYMRANYTPEQIRQFVERRNAAIDPVTGEWVPIDTYHDHD